MKPIFSILSILSLLLFACGQKEREDKPNTITDNQINAFIDAWHLAAADADSTKYFGAFTDKGMFLGTDASEVWTVEEFRDFSMPYFRKGKAWAFTATDRNLYRDGSLIWFDEILDTWMGPCRGTGVIKLSNRNLLIEHYSLSVLVPNETIQDYLKLLN